MILLKNIKTQERSAELVTVAADTHVSPIAIEPIVTAAGNLGLRHLHMQDALGAQQLVKVPTEEARDALVGRPRDIHDPGLDGKRAEQAGKDLDTVLHDHRCVQQPGHLVYEAQFAHEPVAPGLIAAYVSLLLATAGASESRRLQFRLAMYEMCANILEHGTLRQSPAEIGLHIELNVGEVRGWIQDGCTRFDLSTQPIGSIRDHADTRASRGYGIYMMHQLLESIDHEFNTTGNRIHFKKRIAP